MSLEVTPVLLEKLSQTVFCFFFFSGTKATAGEIEMMLIQVVEAECCLLSKAEKDY